ncbi:MAG: hypothetical protein O7B80_02115, partial [bacterium]|nr:hypothetical protein [bacterium]
MKSTGRLLGALVVAGASFLLILTSFSYEAEQAGTVPTPQALPDLSSTEVPKSTRLRLKAAYGKLPLHFEPNQGQVDPQVNFLSKGNGYTLFLTPTGAVLALRMPKERPGARSRESGSSRSGAPAPQSTVIRMRLVGASPSPEVS